MLRLLVATLMCVVVPAGGAWAQQPAAEPVPVQLKPSAGEACAASRGAAGPAGLYQRIVESKRLCVGVRSALPPFSYKDKDSGAWKGFDVALARLVGEHLSERLDAAVDVVLVGFDRPDQVLKAVQSGHVDFAAAAITRTRQRDLSGVDFSVDYFLDRQELLVDAKAFAGLDTAQVAVLAGSTAEAKWGHRHPEVKLSPCPNHAECVRLLKEGKVQAYGGDRAIILWQVLQAGLAERFKLSGLAEFGDFEDTYWMEPYGVVVPENQSAVRDLVNEAFEAAWDEDLIDTLFQLHFGDRSAYKGRISYDLPHVAPSHVPEPEQDAPGPAPRTDGSGPAPAKAPPKPTGAP